MDENKITLEFDDGFVLEAEIMGTFDVNGVEYIALGDESSEDVYLYRYIEIGEEGDDFELGDIPDEDFEAVKAEFDAIMDNLEE